MIPGGQISTDMERSEISCNQNKEMFIVELDSDSQHYDLFRLIISFHYFSVLSTVIISSSCFHELLLAIVFLVHVTERLQVDN